MAAARGSAASWRASATGKETARTFAGARFPASCRAGPGPPAGPLRASGGPRLPSHRPGREGRGGEARGGRHPRALPSAPVRPGVPAARRPLSLGGAPRSRVPLRGGCRVSAPRGMRAEGEADSRLPGSATVLRSGKNLNRVHGVLLGCYRLRVLSGEGGIVQGPWQCLRILLSLPSALSSSFG